MTGREGLRAVFVTGAINGVLKRVIHRERPNGRDDRSFPSHHSASSFAIVAVAANQYGNGAVSYGLAGMTALSRVNDNEHWFSDILLGSTLGYFVGKAVASN